MAVNGSMRAAVLEEPHADLKIEEIPIPEPKRDEILVRVTACGVCHTDLHVIKDETPFPTPAILGHEITGTVEALGPGLEERAEELKEGTPVAASFIMPCGECQFCVRGRDDVCERFISYNRLQGVLYDGETRLFREDGSPLAMYSMGGLAEYAVVPATDIFPLPEELPAEESSILGCAVFTAYGAVRHAADLHPGETVAVVAMGGVGSNMVQLSRASRFACKTKDFRSGPDETRTRDLRHAKAAVTRERLLLTRGVAPLLEKLERIRSGGTRTRRTGDTMIFGLVWGLSPYALKKECQKCWTP